VIRRAAFGLALVVLPACAAVSTEPPTPTLEIPATLPAPGAADSTLPIPTTLVADDGRPAADRRLEFAFRVLDDGLQPKSIVHSGTGLFFAQNMMYRHNVSVFDREGRLVSTIDDRVDLAAFGVAREGKATVVRGSPVEAAFTSDGRHAFVSNYKMYGDGWSTAADDLCLGNRWEPSYVYRIDVATMTIDQVIPVGAVPKFLAVSPDDSTLVVSNWCSLDASIVDVATGTERARVVVGLHPRGVAITSDSSVAYVSVMGGPKIVRIDLATLETRSIESGSTPRHLVLSPDDSTLYVSNNLAGTIRAIDLATGRTTRTLTVGEQPRTMAMSDDGTALYVVVYRRDALVKVRTSDMSEVQRVETGVRPIGVTYDAATRRVWVANYAGSLSVYDDR
jgi:YVTN family beta-propeller protein